MNSLSRDSFCSNCHHQTLTSSPIPSHIYNNLNHSPNMHTNPHTPNHQPNTPEWVTQKNPWFMTPVRGHIGGVSHPSAHHPSFDPYLQSPNMYPSPNYMHSNQGLSSMIYATPPPLPNHGNRSYCRPNNVHHPQVQPSQQAKSLSDAMSNLYLRSAPPGFPPIPDSKSSSYLHTHHLDKMNYATNLFNKSSVESR